MGYSTATYTTHEVPGQTIALIFFALWFLFRYLRLLIGIYANFSYKSIPIPDEPRYRPEDVTVIIPTTFKSPPELSECIRNVLAARPAQVIIVTSDSNVALVKALCAVSSFNAMVLGVEKFNKRTQMSVAIPHVETSLIAFADDDVFWSTPEYLRYLATPFEDSRVGAAGTRQRTRRYDPPNVWNFLGISYLERRVFNNITTNAIDGSLSTLSGRTAMFRTEILKDPAFLYHFNNDTYQGKRLNSDDDKCLTRWVYSKGWKIVIQSHPDVILETTLNNDRTFLDQCLRWERSSKRGNFTVMAKETYWYRTHWFGLYVIYVSQFFQFALLNDIVSFALLAYATSGAGYQRFALIILAAWIFFTKIVKLIPHFLRHPADLRFVPVSIAFSYFHSLLRLYCWLTLTNTKWSGKDLKKLEHARATDSQVVPMLKEAVAATEPYHEPTPGKITARKTTSGANVGADQDAGVVMGGDDYFSAQPIRLDEA
jgi:hypothetical protein